MIQPPDYSAFINPIACTAVAMRYEHRQDHIQSIVVDTGKEPGRDLSPITLVDYTVQTQSCDALMYIVPFVMVTTPLDPEYAGQFILAKFHAMADGEPKVFNEPVSRYLLAPPYEMKADSSKPLVLLGEKERALLGVCRLQFLPNGSHIALELKGVPSGGGEIRINAGVLMGLYTTRVKTGAGIDVGALDAQQQAYPISHTWETAGDALTQEKLESVHGDTIRELVTKKATEIEEERHRRGAAEFGQTMMEVERRHQVAMDMERRRIEEAKKRAEEDAALRAKKKPWEKANDYGEMPGDICCQRATGKFCHEHDAANYQPNVDLEETSHVDLEETPHVDLEETPHVDLEETLQRAKRRLICWGVIAVWIFLCIAGVVYWLTRKGGIE